MPKLDIVGNAGGTDPISQQTYRDTAVGLTAQIKIPLYEGGLLSSNAPVAAGSRPGALYPMLRSGQATARTRRQHGTILLRRAKPSRPRRRVSPPLKWRLRAQSRNLP